MLQITDRPLAETRENALDLGHHPLDRGVGDVYAGDDCPAPPPGERIKAEVALEMEKRPPSDVPDLVHLDRVERLLAAKKARTSARNVSSCRRRVSFSRMISARSTKRGSLINSAPPSPQDMFLVSWKL